ncbi:hypothetical protein GCM10010404_52520 [Nonomuraea africana]|uniref:Uncharacterized protein n=1 Tax=Nonomuraea africana TaxID=46171 RepID=A0ABR9KGE9_9ACTN|nr:hypothetical protein [Nonomuraea africana]MBE1561095.1 hypothetical protein [Nonomuraea africana]
MRFVSRILTGAAIATAVAVGAPVAASAATVGAATTGASWGAYHSSDHKASALGQVDVAKKSYKTWHWETFYKKVKVCWKDKHGNKHCVWKKKSFKKKVWTWKHDYFFTVDSTLTNHKWWGKKKYVCAWETFKVVNFNGSTYLKSFKNCGKGGADYSFSGKNAEHIYVDVSRGNYGGPQGFHSGWKAVYHA